MGRKLEAGGIPTLILKRLYLHEGHEALFLENFAAACHMRRILIESSLIIRAPALHLQAEGPKL